MGKSEDGAYRGDTEVILKAAIEKIPDSEFRAFLEKAEERGMLEASKYSSQLDLCSDLANIEQTYKDEVADALRAGKGFFDD